MELQNWIRGLGYPENMDEFRKLEGEGDNLFKMEFMVKQEMIYILMEHYKY